VDNREQERRQRLIKMSKSKVKHLTRTHEKHNGFMDKELSKKMRLFIKACLEILLKLEHDYEL